MGQAGHQIAKVGQGNVTDRTPVSRGKSDHPGQGQSDKKHHKQSGSANGISYNRVA